MIPKLTGNLFRAGRALVGLTRDELGARANLSRDVLRSWEISSESIVPAQYQMLCRAIEALESEGVRFSEAGVYLQRPEPIAGTVVHSSAWRRSVYEIHLPHDRQTILDDRTIKG